MAEFVEGFERLEQIHPSVSIFGSARTPAGHPLLLLAEQIARLLSDAGFSVVSGGGPGIMEAVNKGAHAGKGPSVGLNIQLPHEQSRQSLSGHPSHLPPLFRAQGDVREIRLGVRGACRAASAHSTSSWRS